MASKNSAVRSIRLMKPKWEALAAYAEKQGITVNAALDRAADLLLALGSGGPKPQVVSPKPAKAAKVRVKAEAAVAPEPATKPKPEPTFKPREDTYPAWMRKK